jgi:riboflavin biosynthesis pyrimidine reductase
MIELRRLETGGTVGVTELFAPGELTERAHPDRPYVIANFVSSLDGRATFQGRSGALGDEADLAMFMELRTQVDAIMVGTGTLRVERYGRLIRAPERRARRGALGLNEDALGVIVSRSGAVPYDIPMFAEAEQPIALCVPDDVDVPTLEAQVRRHALVDFGDVLAVLRQEHGVRALLCEGGPGVLSAMLHQRFVDELFLTLAPKLTGGGEGPRLTTGPEMAELVRAERLWALEYGDQLFLRYALCGNRSSGHGSADP